MDLLLKTLIDILSSVTNSLGGISDFTELILTVNMPLVELNRLDWRIAEHESSY
jgi:hypothetical protein